MESAGVKILETGGGVADVVVLAQLGPGGADVAGEQVLQHPLRHAPHNLFP